MKKLLTVLLVLSILSIAVCFLSSTYSIGVTVGFEILSICVILKGLGAFRQLEKTVLDLRQNMSYYEKAAATDALTGLLNRRGGEEYINTSMARSRRTKSTFSTIIMDIDHFKQINDKYGHSVGDMVISEVAKIIISTLRVADFAIRWGGEEFLICLPDTDLSGALLVAEKLRHVIDKHSFDNLKVTASFGCAEMGDDDFDIMVARADMHLYMAKSRGRNTVFPRRNDL